MENFLDKFKSMALEGYLKKHFSKYLQDGAVSVFLRIQSDSRGGKRAVDYKRKEFQNSRQGRRQVFSRDGCGMRQALA